MDCGIRCGETIRGAFPHSESTLEGICIRPCNAGRGESLEFLYIPSTENNIVRQNSGCEQFHSFKDMLRPALLAVFLQSPDADVILKGLLLEGKVSKFEWEQGIISDDCAPKSRTQSKEEHLASLVASEGLHGGIIDHFDRAAEGLLIIEVNPATPKVERLGHREVVVHWSWKSNGDDVKFPPLGQKRDILHELGRGKRGAGSHFTRLLFTAEEDFHMGAADIDGENFHACRVLIWFG